VGNINSIGLDFTQKNTASVAPASNPHVLLIGTKGGLIRYDFALDKVITQSQPNQFDSQVYIASYRNQLTTGLPENYHDSVTHMPVTAYSAGSNYIATILHDHVFGNNITTAYYTTNSGAEALITSCMNVFWATEKGLFQVNRSYAQETDRPFLHYNLEGAKINKINSVYSLVGFGNQYSAGQIRENLLIGTDQGLYFSNSGYNKFSSNPVLLNDMVFYHYDGLGNKKINDIEVNQATYSATPQSGFPVCEDGFWLAAADGLYFLKTDYTHTTLLTRQQAIQFEGQNGSVTDLQVCSTAGIKAILQDSINTGTATQWFKDGQGITNATTPSLNLTQPGEYYAWLTDLCSGLHMESNHLKLTVTGTPPTISLQQIVNTTLCSGQTVDLKATYSGGTVKWSTGDTSGMIKVTQSGTYAATISTTGGCSASTDIDIQFFNNPILTLPDATLCQFTKDQLTLTAPAGFAKYVWNGQPGTQTFTTGSLGPVSLMVTDNNGCTASQTINITSHCKDLHIPNTITPNGDGINDKWVITGLENDASVNVKIYNRNGDLLLESPGYSKPWDGTYKGKRVPAGVYFYVITAKTIQLILSGSVTVIY
jgi:gliding motility-associated-like protein